MNNEIKYYQKIDRALNIKVNFFADLYFDFIYYGKLLPTNLYNKYNKEKDKILAFRKKFNESKTLSYRSISRREINETLHLLLTYITYIDKMYNDNY